jgi:hypothetical protein
MFGMKENCMTLLWWTLSLSISMARVITTNSDFKNNHGQNNTVYYILLTPWGQNPRVHHRVHKSPPPIPFLSHLNPLHSQVTVPKIHSASILPSTPRSSEWSLSFGLFYQNSLRLYTYLLSHACRVPANVIFLHFICLMISGVQYKLRRSPLCNFLLSAVTTFLLGPYILLRTLFSNTLILCNSLNVTVQVSHI